MPDSDIFLPQQRVRRGVAGYRGPHVVVVNAKTGQKAKAPERGAKARAPERITIPGKRK